MKKIDIIGIMAQDKNGLIGLNNDLPWKDDPSTKWDMKHFKETTIGYPVIMGYRTYEGLPKPLKNRINFVIDSHNTLQADNVSAASSVSHFTDEMFYTVPDLQTVRKIIENQVDTDRAFLIGGAKTVIRAVLDNDLDKFILTTFNKSYFNGEDDVVYLDLESINYKVIDTDTRENGKIEILDIED